MIEANETVGTAKQLVPFGQAVKALKEGKMVRRSEWNKDFFIFKQVPSSVNKTIVPKMTSLPDSVKSELIKRFEDLENHSIDSIHYVDQIALVNWSGRIDSYTPSVIDVFAEDWVVLV